MRRDDLEELELRLLLEAIYHHYGYDFREYARGSIKRRIWRRMEEETLPTISALQERVLHDPTEDRTRQFLARVIAAGRLN